MPGERYLPGFWRKFQQWYKLSSRPDKPTGKLVYQGEDLNGNLYFESLDKYGRLIRFVEPKNINVADLPSIPEINISPEWLRWLRKNRDDPPQEEEMVRNAAIAFLKKQRATELENEERKNWPELDAKLKQIEEERDYHPISLFPLYRDLEVTPGQEYMLNRGFYIPDLQDNPNLLEQQKQSHLSADDSKLTADEKKESSD